MSKPELLTIEAASITTLLKAVLRVVGGWRSMTGGHRNIWFRGVNDEKHGLLPGLYWRKGAKPNTEQHAAAYFMRSAPPLLGSNPKDSWEWYFLMQHYGLPTRLLDWTENCLTALFFAIRKPKASARPCIWMIDPSALSAARLGSDFDNIYLPGGPTSEYYLWHKCTADSNPSSFKIDGKQYTNEFPIAILPPCIDPRITAQQSMFTLHGTSRCPIEDIMTKGERPYNRMIAKFILDCEDLDSVRKELRWLGLRESSLFPEPQILAEDIQEHLGIAPIRR